jgi:hypothetical protein
MALVPGIQRRVSTAAALSLLVAGAILIVALAAAANTRAAGRELKERLVPAAAAAAVLLNDYTSQQTSLRSYVTTGQPAELAAFRQAAALGSGSREQHGGPFGFAHYEGPELGGAHVHGIRVMLRQPFR